MNKLSKTATAIIVVFVCFSGLALISLAAAQSPTPTGTAYGDYYVVTNAGPGGSINGIQGESNALFAYPGSSFNFIITPDNGYRILDVTDNGESKGAVETYNLTNVQTSHTINATFTQTDTTTPTPTIPELPWITLLPLLFAIPIASSIIEKKKRQTIRG